MLNVQKDNFIHNIVSIFIKFFRTDKFVSLICYPGHSNLSEPTNKIPRLTESYF
jgi:hypothetical protein